MAIPGMITDFNRQNVNYGMAVGQSLQQLGQQVGQTLAMQQYQRQAQAQLPFIAEQMQVATREASEGKFGDAYSKIIGLTADPSVTQNPFILPALEMGMQAIKQGSSQAWFNLQNRQQGGGGGTDFETEVVYETPTAEQMADPNYRPVARVVPKTTPTRGGGMGGGGGGGGTTGGSLQEQFQAIDESTPLPGMEARFEDTVSEMDTGGEQGGFGFGWSYEEGYRPTADRRKSFEKEYNDFLNAPVEEQEKIKEQAQIPQEEVPEGKQVIPFRMALNPDIVGITGPKSSVQVEKITQVFKDGSQEDRRDLIMKDPLAATINDLQKADSIISGNNTLLNIHKQVDGNYNRVTTEREFQTDDPKTDTFKIFIDGNEAPDVKTDINGAEAIGIMRAKEVAALTGKYGFVTGQQPTEAPAAGAPQTTADKVRAKFGKTDQAQPAAPAATPSAPQAPAASEFSPENPFAQEAQTVQAAPAATPRAAERTRGLASRQITAKKNLDSINDQIKNINDMKVGRRNATPTEKARRWEELNAEKKRLEGILAQ